MIVPIEEALEIDEYITREDLAAFEEAIRQLTNNNFHNNHVRFKNIEIIDRKTIKVNQDIEGLRSGDTIELNYSNYNDGLYVVDKIYYQEIQVKSNDLYKAKVNGAMVTKVEYPADISFNIKKMIAYDKEMGNKIGVKSESISRMSKTYHDVNSTENTEGYPSNMLSFLDKYKKMRW